LRFRRTKHGVRSICASAPSRSRFCYGTARVSKRTALVLLLASVHARGRTIHVDLASPADFHSVQRAVDAAASGDVIAVSPGIYREVVVIAKPNLTLRGEGLGPEQTVIVFDKSAGSTGSTFRSSTVEVRGDDFHASNLTFANDFNATHPQLPQGAQALALFVDGDRAVFRNMRFLGNQDTLYAASRNCNPDGDPCIPARQYFSNCYIAGNVDFIFGDGKAFFDQCEIHSTAHDGGYITAQGKHYAEEDSGFVFDRCKLTAEAGMSHVWLGRPWRPYATVVFLNTEMGAHIDPAGWREWHPGETSYIETVFYAEYNSTGAGSHAAERDPHTKHLSASEASRYKAASFLAGADRWDPTAVRP
jgi:pectin methylesterase-like acyl-CoA thioesterase